MAVNPEHWHLSKTVSLSHIGATVGAVAVGLSAYFGVIERLSLLEQSFIDLSERVISVLETQRRIDDKQDQSLAALREDVRADIRGIESGIAQVNAKLDRLIENMLNGRPDR